MKKKYSIICLILGLAIFSNIYAQQKTEKEIFENINNIETAFEYIRRYPNGKNIENAINMLEKYYYERGRKNNSIINYEKYLLLYPNGKFVKDIEEYYNSKDIEWIKKYIKNYKWGYFYTDMRNKYEEHLYNSIKNSDSYKELKRYTDNYPMGEYISIIEKKMDRIFYKKYKNSKNIKEIDEYLSTHSSTEYKDELENRLEKLYFDKIKGISEANTYISKYPDGDYIKEAKKMKEKYYFDKVNNVKSANIYLNKYPNGKYTKKVKDIREENIYNSAIKTKRYNEYLNKYPNGKYTEKIKMLKEKYIFQNIKTKIDTDNYLSKYPNGKYSSKVKKMRRKMIWKNMKQEAIIYKDLDAWSFSRSNVNFNDNKFEFDGGNEYYKTFGNEELEINNKMNINYIGMKFMDNFNMYNLEIGMGGAENLNFDDPSIHVKYLGGKASYYKDFIPFKHFGLALGTGVEYSSMTIWDESLLKKLSTYKNGSLMTGILANIIYKPLLLEYRYEISLFREDSWSSNTLSISYGF